MRFWAGFLTASVLWGGTFYAYYAGHILAEDAEPEPVASVEAPLDDPSSQGKKSRKKRPLRRRDGTSVTSDRESTTGDDLDWEGARAVDMQGAEEQLSGAEIEAGFDSVMGRIRRCLVLVPSDGDVAGRLTFGMRVGGDGKPKAVNLSGPSIVTTGESGSCLRSAAQGIRFATFQGPDMLFKFPIDLQ